MTHIIVYDQDQFPFLYNDFLFNGILNLLLKYCSGICINNKFKFIESNHRYNKAYIYTDVFLVA